MLNEIILWISNHIIELLGAITGLIYLYPEIKQKVWVWPFGAATALLFIFIFFEKKFYADMCLQFYYLFISLYGWYNWISKKNDINEIKQLSVTSIPNRIIFISSFITFIIFIIIFFLLNEYTDSPVPFGDAFTTALSITATWMLAKKYIEMWYLWIITNLILFLLFFYKEMYAMGILFIIYFVFSFIGYYEWRKDLKMI